MNLKISNFLKIILSPETRKRLLREVKFGPTILYILIQCAILYYNTREIN